MNPFEINVADLRRRHAAERSVDISATVDWSLELSHVATGEGGDNVTAQVTLSPIAGGLMAHGTVSLVAVHICHRCLNEWSEEMVVPINAVFSTRAGRDDDGGDAFPLGDVIDLEPALRDDVLLSFPLSPSCPEQCVEQLVEVAENSLNTPASAEQGSARGAPEARDDESSPFSVLKDLLGPEA